MTAARSPILSEDLLKRFHERAPAYDRKNRCLAKAFGSLTPVWTLLGLHAMDASDPKGPKIVHGFLSRDAKGYRSEPTWDVLGMRATRSDDTILEGAFVPDSRIGRIVAAGAAGID